MRAGNMAQRAVYLQLAIMSLLLSKGIFAAEPEQATDTRAQAAPSQALLEFLADFETDDGKWIDPFELLNMFGEKSPDESKEALEND